MPEFWNFGLDSILDVSQLLIIILQWQTNNVAKGFDQVSVINFIDE